jgi:hypothetical protein
MGVPLQNGAAAANGTAQRTNTVHLYFYTVILTQTPAISASATGKANCKSAVKTAGTVYA